MCAEKRTRSEQHRIGKVGNFWGGIGENKHELEKNAKMPEKKNAIISV